MLAKLLERGPDGGQRREIAVTKEEFLIGRGADCDLRLRLSAISRHHCLLRVRQAEVTLADLGSANGTFVNGQQIRSQATIHDNDEITIADCHFVILLQAQSGIDWGPEGGAVPGQTTQRFDKPKGLGTGNGKKKKESHPPGKRVAKELSGG